MTRDDRLAISVPREERLQESMWGIVGLGLVATAVLGALAFFAKRKLRLLGLIISFLILPLLAILIASRICAFLRTRNDEGPK